jgi:hypothetical protein
MAKKTHGTAFTLGQFAELNSAITRALPKALRNIDPKLLLPAVRQYGGKLEYTMTSALLFFLRRLPTHASVKATKSLVLETITGFTLGQFAELNAAITRALPKALRNIDPKLLLPAVQQHGEILEYAMTNALLYFLHGLPIQASVKATKPLVSETITGEVPAPYDRGFDAEGVFRFLEEQDRLA